MKKVILLSLLMLIVISVSLPAYAKDVKFHLSLSDKETVPGRQVILDLIFPGQIDIPKPEIPFINGIDSRYKGFEIKDLEEDGIALDSAVYSYGLMPSRTGDIEIGPIIFEHAGKRYISDVVVLVTTENESLNKKKRGGKSKRDDLSGRVYIETDIPKTEIYVNEIIPITVKFYSDWLDIEDLQVSDTPSDDYIADEYVSLPPKVVNVGDMKFAVLSFGKTFFALSPGKFVFGPVRTIFNVVKSSDKLLNDNGDFYDAFIGRRNSRTIEMNGDAVEIKVIPLPNEGRPTDFSGAVGDFAFTVSADKDEINLDGVIKLDIKISGTGNFDMIKLPVMSNMPGIIVDEPVIVREMKSVFAEQTVKIVSEGVEELPSLVFHFFSPSKKKYVSIINTPMPVKILPPVGKKGAIIVTPVLPELIKEGEHKKTGIIDIKKNPGTMIKSDLLFYKSGFFVFLWIFPLIVAIIISIFKKRNDILSGDTAYARWYHASRFSLRDLSRAKFLLKKNRVREFYDHIFKMTQRYFGVRFGVPSGAISGEVVLRLILPEMLQNRTVKQIEDIFTDCYFARFTSIEFDLSDMKKTCADIEEILVYFNGIRNI